MRMFDIPGKWKSFGWEVMEIDGHNTEEVVKGLDFLVNTNDNPAILIAHTIKGKGVSYMEDNPAFHGAAPNDEQFRVAMEELGEVIGMSRMAATRDGYGQALLDLARNEKVVVLEADLGKSTKSLHFRKAHPERTVSCGIGEQNMLLTAAGLASSGYIPFASTFAIFTERAFEQMRNGVARPNLRSLVWQPWWNSHRYRRFICTVNRRSSNLQDTTKCNCNAPLR